MATQPLRGRYDSQPSIRSRRPHSNGASVFCSAGVSPAMATLRRRGLHTEQLSLRVGLVLLLVSTIAAASPPLASITFGAASPAAEIVRCHFDEGRIVVRLSGSLHVLRAGDELEGTGLRLLAITPESATLAIRRTLADREPSRHQDHRTGLRRPARPRVRDRSRRSGRRLPPFRSAGSHPLVGAPPSGIEPGRRLRCSPPPPPFESTIEVKRRDEHHPAPRASDRRAQRARGHRRGKRARVLLRGRCRRSAHSHRRAQDRRCHPPRRGVVDERRLHPPLLLPRNL